MKRTMLVLLFVGLAAFGLAPRSQGDDAKGLSELMQRKLKNSQKVLEGIALADFDLIAKHADELILVSKEAEWKVLKTPQYELFSNEFRRSAENMIKKAREKNIDGATLAYVDMTMNCVKCHKYVREVKTTRLEPREGLPEVIGERGD